MKNEKNGTAATKRTLFALLMAVCMMASVAPVFADTDSSDAASSVTGTVDVTYYNGTYGTETVSAFDLYQAVAAAAPLLGYTVTSSNSAYNVDMGGYYDINPDYGKIDALNGSQTFYVYVYGYTGTGNDMAWTEAHDAIGWYRPFSDYGTKICFYNADAPDNRGDLAGAANIVLSVTPLAVADIDAALDERSMTHVITPANGDANNVDEGTMSDYMYKFRLKDATFDTNGNPVVTITGTQHHVGFTLMPLVIAYDEDTGDYYNVQLTLQMVKDGVTVVGFGSDAYMALNNALKAYNMGDGQRICVLPHDGGGYTYNTYYSWISSILKTPTYSNFVSNPDGSSISEYWYWASYTGAVSPANYASYTLGYYSNLSGGFNDATSFGSYFSLDYEYSGMTVPAP